MTYAPIKNLSILNNDLRQKKNNEYTVRQCALFAYVVKLIA